MKPYVIARTVLEKTAYSFDKPYSYLVPESLLGICKAGCRVTVPFGRGNSSRQGLVLSLEQTDSEEGLKSVISVLDSTPILNDEMLKMCEWLHETLFCTYFDAVSTLLPAGVSFKMVDSYMANPEFNNTEQLKGNENEVFSFIKAKGEYVSVDKLLKTFGFNETSVLTSLYKSGALLKESNAVRKIGDATLKSVRLKTADNDFSSFKLTEKQNEVAEYIYNVGAVSVKELCYFTGVTQSVVDAVVKKGIAEYFEQAVYRIPKRSGTRLNEKIVLTDEQQQVFGELQGKLNSYNCSLLYGVTGSGKTQVFLRLVDEVLKENKSVIIMVPEISLTPQVISIFSNRYGDKISVFHSAMSLGQRMDEWKRIKENKAQIAIGTRSAIFAPIDNIGLIVMDEEQEHTYKSEQSPRFHARDIARFRAKYHNCLFLMASATPSVETYAAALNGKYSLSTLKHRYGTAVLPEVEVVDMRKELQQGCIGAVSSALYNAIDEALNDNKQAIVLLNRRGHNTYISCPACGNVAACPNCSVSLTYHSANKRLMCHYCGYSEAVPQKCSQCGETHLKFSGMGTQKVEEELQALFPDSKILRLDADSTVTRNSFSEYLTDFADGKYDIMLGTQMVAKGLDFPNVTVVGVIGAEKSMNGEDYRSVERTFSLLTQVVGRAGRGENAGKAIIQTTDPDNNIITLAQNQDYDKFFSDEILIRKGLAYPPYTDIVSLSVSGLSRDKSSNTIYKIFNNIKDLVAGDYADIKLIVLGPSAATVPKVNNKYRFKMLVKCKNNRRLRELLRKAIDFKYDNDVSVVIDINPEVLI